MPNHVHAIVRPLGDQRLDQILHSWKSFTSKEINKVIGHKGSLWEEESYDHIIRTNNEFENQMAYVLDNPKKAQLIDWPWVGKNQKWQSEFRGQDAPDTRERDAPGTSPMPDDDLRLAIQNPTDERLWAICEGLRRGWPVEEVNRLCRVDPWFLNKLLHLIGIESDLIGGAEGAEERALAAGFAPRTIAELSGRTPSDSANRVFKMVDTCAGEFESKTPYFYGAWEKEDDTVRC